MSHPLWLDHKPGDKYRMDGEGEWELYYYPIFGNGETQEEYDEPRALMKTGTDSREVPLRYIARIIKGSEE